MAKTFKITVLPGDGIGPEIIEQAVRVLDLISKKTGLQLELTTKDFGGAAIDNHGNPLPDDTLKACQESDAVLFGAVGGPKWGTGAVRPEQGILKLRKELGLYANIRPASFASENLLQYSPLKENIAKGVDIIVVRELIGGIYFGDRTEDNGEGVAVDTCKYSVEEVERITRVAARIALAANPPLQVTSLDKANVMATSRLWRKTFERVMKDEFPQLQYQNHLIDSAAMLLVSNPRKLNGVVVTENLFGDIISDETSVIPGSLGLLPSASLAGAPDASKSIMGVYEPIHGSAPDIAGQGIANPIGMILSAALMLRYSLGCAKEADAVEAAVRKVLDSSADGGYDFRTKDLGGDKGTQAVGDKILEVLETLL
ncbi:3-isopropylmalate dehydrogenase [Cutaneotrichosporon oleaginosum]|uniref:3-isopropylmalate dehydrogenase n=1 Tax=Cutaneotrichosporon oleaginosum TaxID=879819 RepID=A0A0J0XTR0_9TREE|nr:3-isopropylmalate dehydrogenase [Cutaneotrichosporon oleaginosum]KLT44445.1 3-isopropylmalate dehydrogenase [Cutaneotrichosporon oleaginosum]